MPHAIPSVISNIMVFENLTGVATKLSCFISYHVCAITLFQTSLETLPSLCCSTWLPRKEKRMRKASKNNFIFLHQKLSKTKEIALKNKIQMRIKMSYQNIKNRCYYYSYHYYRWHTQRHWVCKCWSKRAWAHGIAPIFAATTE